MIKKLTINDYYHNKLINFLYINITITTSFFVTEVFEFI